MEISEHTFYMFWAVISAIFLKLGFDAIDIIELSNSVPRLAVFLFTDSLAIVTYYSFVLACCPRSRICKSVNIFLISFTSVVFLFVFLFGYWVYCIFPIFTVTTLYNLCLIVYDNGGFTSDPDFKRNLVYFARVTLSATIYPCLAPFGIRNDGLCMVAYSIYASFLVELENKRSRESLPSTDPEVHDQNLTFSSCTNSSRMKKSIEFAVGLLGTIVFQNFIKLNSFKQVVAFLYLAVSWLASLIVISPSQDLGVFNFLLGNAIVGCSVSEFGLGGKTWIAYAASVFLYCLRLKIQSLSFINRGGGNRKVILW